MGKWKDLGHCTMQLGISIEGNGKIHSIVVWERCTFLRISRHVKENSKTVRGMDKER